MVLLLCMASAIVLLGTSENFSIVLKKVITGNTISVRGT